MSKQKIPVTWRNCAACTHWCGQKNLDMFCQFVEFDTSEQARCASGGFNNTRTPGMGTCLKWQCYMLNNGFVLKGGSFKKN